MDAATLEEMNKTRISLGMKPLPVPGAKPVQTQREESPDSDGEVASTIESRQAQAYDNFKKAQEADEAKRKRGEKAAAVKKARDAALRFATIEGKGLGESDMGGDTSTKSWLMNQKKRQKKIEKARKWEEEQAAAEAAAAAAVQYTAKDLAGVKVGHDMSKLLDGDDQILTLKDTTIDENEEEGDELENVHMRDKEKLDELLELKKKKPAYNVHDDDGEGGILAQYDEEIYGKKSKKFTLDAGGAIAEFAASLDEPREKRAKSGGVNLNMLDDAPAASDYIDISEIKVKKPKKKKSKSARQRPVDDDDIFPLEPDAADEELMDVDSAAQPSTKKRKATDDSFVDDEDLQASLAIQRRAALKNRKRIRPEDIAKKLKEDVIAEAEEPQDSGLVINDISEFVAGLRNPGDEEERKPKKSKSAIEPVVTAMEEDSEDEDHPMKDDVEQEIEPKREDSAELDMSTMGVDEEKTVGQGMGATLALLRERGLVKAEKGADLNADFRRRAEFLARKRQMELDADEYAKQQRERDRTSGRMDRMSDRDRQENARAQNERRDLAQSRHLAQLFQAEYKPNVELKYTDEYGRRLDQKEAFRHLSHQFHGKGSGKGKTDKLLKKIEDEKRRESQSMLDASQNVGMSSATAQQLKKRKEAGVRLA